MSDGALAALLADVRGRFDKLDDTLAFILSRPAPVGIGDIVRFDHIRDRWLIWNGVRWRPDVTKGILNLTRIRAAEWLAAALDGSITQEDVKSILSLQNYAKKVSVLKMLSAFDDPPIAMTGNEWDTSPYLVGFDNGIMDLQTATWYAEPDPSLLVSKSVGYDWDPKAECPTFDWFLDDIMGGDAELVAYLRRMVGYFLLGLTTEQKFWLWVGRGSNGKGVLAHTLHKVFGDYAEAPADTLYMRTRFGAARSDAARPDLLRLQSVRFAYMSEPPGGQFNEEALKAHTGEDSIIARNLYAKAEQVATFRPTHKIVFLTNDPPKTDDVGDSMGRRVRVVRFERSYMENPDRTLETRLVAERQGIMNMAIREALDYLSEGLPEPAAVTAWSREYIEENDPIGQFLADRCVIGRRERGSATTLWASYEDWAAKNDVEPMSKTGLGLALSRRFTRRKSHGTQVYLGVRALNAGELADAEG